MDYHSLNYLGLIKEIYDKQHKSFFPDGIKDSLAEPLNEIMHFFARNCYYRLDFTKEGVIVNTKLPYSGKKEPRVFNKKNIKSLLSHDGSIIVDKVYDGLANRIKSFPEEESEIKELKEYLKGFLIMVLELDSVKLGYEKIDYLEFVGDIKTLFQLVWMDKPELEDN